MSNAVREIVGIIGDLVAQWKQTSVNLAKIEASIYYLKGIKVARFALLGIVALFTAVILLLSGWILLHVALIFLIPWNPGARLAVAVVLALINILIPAVAVFMILSEKRWMRLTHSDKIVDEAV